MTHYTIMTTPDEADLIMEDRKTVIFRDNKIPYKEGDIISFNVIKGGKSVRHSIDNRQYQAIFVANWGKAPMQPGYVVINFKRVV